MARCAKCRRYCAETVLSIYSGMELCDDCIYGEAMSTELVAALEGCWDAGYYDVDSSNGAEIDCYILVKTTFDEFDRYGRDFGESECDLR